MRTLLALILFVPLSARAWPHNNDSPDCDDSGASYTQQMCADPGSALCVRRLAKTIESCKRKLDGKGSQKDKDAIAERLNRLLTIPESHTPAAAPAQDAAEKTRKSGLGGAGGGGVDPGTGDDNPASVQDTLLKGKTALQSGDTKSAIAAANKALASDPKNVEALQLRAQAEFAQGDKNAAADDARTLLSLDRNNQLGHLIIDGDKGMGDAAIKRALKSPDFGAARDGGSSSGGGKNLGDLKGQALRSSAASSTPRAPTQSQIVMTVQSPAAGFLQEAESKLRMRDLSGALAGASRAISADPKNPKAWALRATIWNQMGKPAEAVKDADEALKLDPSNVAALLERGYGKYQLGEFQDALKDVEKALSLDPLNAMGYLYKGMILEKLDRAKDAVTAYMKAVQLDPGLKPLVEDALVRLGVMSGAPGKAGAAPGHSWPKLALWGAALLAALALLFKGVKRAVKPEWATPTTPPTPVR